MKNEEEIRTFENCTVPYCLDRIGYVSELRAGAKFFECNHVKRLNESYEYMNVSYSVSSFLNV